MTHTLKIMSAQDMPDDDPRKNCRIITGVIEVEMGQNSDGLKTLDYTLQDFLRYTTLMPGNAYLYDGQDVCVHAFGVGSGEPQDDDHEWTKIVISDDEEDVVTFVDWWRDPNGALVLQHGDADSIFGYHVLADVTGLSINGQDVSDIDTLIEQLNDDPDVAEALWDAMNASGLESLTLDGMRAVLDHLDGYKEIDAENDHLTYLRELMTRGCTFRIDDLVNTFFDVNKDLHIGSAQVAPTIAAAESWFAISTTPTSNVPAATAEHYARFSVAWAYGKIVQDEAGLWLQHPFLDTAFFLAATMEQLHYRIYRAYRPDVSWLDDQPMRSAAE